MLSVHSALWFCSFHRRISCLIVAFECFKLALWPTLRQKFMNFWKSFTRPGDIIKYDEEISSCSSTPQACPSSRFCRDSRDFLNFSHGLTTRLLISRFFGKYHSEMLLFLNKNRNVILLMKMQYDAVSKRLRHGFALSAISNATKWVKAQLLPSEPCLFSSNISLNSSWIKLYQLQTASTGRISWAKTLKIIN